MKIYNVFYYGDYELNFWGSFSSELLAIDRIVSYLWKYYEAKNKTFEELKERLKFKASEKQEKILNDQVSIFLESFRGVGSIKDIMAAIEKLKNFTVSSYSSFVYTENDEYVLYHRFNFLLGDYFKEDRFLIVETEIDEEIDINIFN